MKNKYSIILVITFLSLISCADKNKKKYEVNNNAIIEIQHFDWLLGNWKRNNEEEGKDTYEVWTKKSNTEYLGFGYTLMEKDTLSQERIKLVFKENNWQIEVQQPDNPEPIVFSATIYNANEFVCENSELSFPNMIKYWKKDNTIHAIISGKDRKLKFDFERIK